MPVAPGGYAGMVEDLARRVLGVCDAVLSVELLALGAIGGGSSDVFALASSADVWLARVEAYPGLALVVGTACEQWRAGLVELLGRWRADAERVCTALSDAAAPGELVHFVGGAGDRHHEGRSVALVRFESGLRIVYEPKDLTVAAATMGLFAVLNAGSDVHLPTRRVVCADGYGWEEHVEAAPAATTSAFETFYRRLGALTRVFPASWCEDLWADNLIAVGDEPHFVDLECVLFAPLDVVGDDAWSLTLRAEQTVVRTAIPLAASTPGFGLYAPDVGCLSHAGDPRSDGGGGVPLGRYRPWTPSQAADPWDFAEAVLAGYRDGDRLLRAHRASLLEPDGPLEAFRLARVRFLARSTWEYQRLLNAYVGANALSDPGVWQELDQAMGASPDASERARSVAACEARSLRDLDIPLFTTVASRGDLYTAAGDLLPGTSGRTAWDELCARTLALDQFPVDAEEEVLRCAIDAARGGRAVAPARRDHRDTRASPRTAGSDGLSRDRVREGSTRSSPSCSAPAVPRSATDGDGWG